MKPLLSILMLISIQAQEYCTMQVHPCEITLDGVIKPADMEPSDSYCYTQARDLCISIVEDSCKPKVSQEVTIVKDKMNSELEKLIQENKKLKKQLRIKKRKK